MHGTVQGLGIDAVGIAIFGFLLKRDLDARDKQIARMTREETLGSLQIELANKKTLRLAQLRQFARVVRQTAASTTELAYHSSPFVTLFTTLVSLYTCCDYDCVNCQPVDLPLTMLVAAVLLISLRSSIEQGLHVIVSIRMYGSCKFLSYCSRL